MDERERSYALEGGVLEHQPAFAAVLEAHGDDTARLDLRDDAGAERLMANVVAGRKIGNVAARYELPRPRVAVVRPRRRPQPLPLDAERRQLVEEAGRQVRLAA